MADNAPIKLAIVGCGAIAEMGHLPAAAVCPDVELTVLIDRDLDRARAMAERFGVPEFAADIAAVPQFAQAACIALPHDLHAPVSNTLMEAGVHVLIEKPLATTVAECDAMIAAAEKAGTVLAVAMPRRFGVSSPFLHQIARKSVLGKVTSFAAESGFAAAWPARSPYLLSFEGSGGGVLMANGCHDLDILTWLFGDVTDVAYYSDAEGNLEGNVLLEMTMASGVKGTLEVSRTRQLNNEIRIETESAVIVAPCPGDQIDIRLRDGSPLMLTGVLGEGKTNVSQGVSLTQLMSDQFSDFARAIRGEAPPMVDGVEARKIVALVQHCYANAKPLPMPWRGPVKTGAQ